MSVEEVTAVEEVQDLSWQVEGTAVLGWAPGWAAALRFTQTQDVVLGQALRILAVAWVGLEQHAGVWVVHALRGPGTWSPPLTGHISVRAEGITTKQDTTTWVREPAVS